MWPDVGHPSGGRDKRKICKSATLEDVKMVHAPTETDLWGIVLYPIYALVPRWLIYIARLTRSPTTSRQVLTTVIIFTLTYLAQELCKGVQ